jgi:hypothetical protein
VVYLPSATVIAELSDSLSDTDIATGPNGAVSATDQTEIVLFRNKRWNGRLCC